MSDGLTDDPDGYEREGVAAFNRMTAAMDGLQSRLDSLSEGLGDKVGQAGQVAARAETAAANARQAAEHAEAVAHLDARQAASRAVLAAAAAFLVAGGGGYWLGHVSGREGGRVDGYRAALDQNAAASWANTPTGRLALALDRAGSLDQLARCNGQGWTPAVQNGRKVCYPSATAGKAAEGWYLP